MNKTIRKTCHSCGKAIIMTEFDYKLNYSNDKEFLCRECNKEKLQQYFKENPEIAKAFKESLYNVMGTPEKREKLADEIVDGWNKLLYLIKTNKRR